MSQESFSDSELLLALRAGDDTALNLLIARWQQPLYAFAWRYLRHTEDSHEVVAETFVRLYRNRENLRPDTRLRGWLFATLVNLCHNHRRWQKRHPTVSLDETPSREGAVSLAETVAHESEMPHETMEMQERRAAVAAAIDLLPHDWKTALLLHHFEQLSYREIAEVLGCAERGIETRIYRAKQRLKTELADRLRDEVSS